MSDITLMAPGIEDVHHVKLTRDELLEIATKGYLVKFQEDSETGLDVITLDIQGVYKND